MITDERGCPLGIQYNIFRRDHPQEEAIKLVYKRWKHIGHDFIVVGTHTKSFLEHSYNHILSKRLFSIKGALGNRTLGCP